MPSLQFGCASLKLDSKSLDREIVIDGQFDDWQDAMTFMEKENVSVGLFNDTDFLYICLVSGNRQISHQIMIQGLTLWFDHKGGKKKIFGIRFPLGIQGGGMIDARKMIRDHDDDQEKIKAMFEDSLTELEILGPDEEDRHHLEASQVSGIEASASLANETLVYELKIPLQKSEQHLYAIETISGKSVGISLETPEFNIEEMRTKYRERMREGRGDFDGGFSRGGRGGGRKGGFGGGRPQIPEPLKIWAKVKLSSGDIVSSNESFVDIK